MYQYFIPKLDIWTYTYSLLEVDNNVIFNYRIEKLDYFSKKTCKLYLYIYNLLKYIYICLTLLYINLFPHGHFLYYFLFHFHALFSYILIIL